MAVRNQTIKGHHMRIVNQATETDAKLTGMAFPANDWEARSKARQAAAKAIVDALGAPIDLSRPAKVAHDAKTDRYQITWTVGDATLTLKATDEVAAFVAQHVRMAGTWIGRMEAGVLVDVYLITVC
jgi:hypothetical protein